MNWTGPSCWCKLLDGSFPWNFHLLHRIRLTSLRVHFRRSHKFFFPLPTKWYCRISSMLTLRWHLIVKELSILSQCDGISSLSLFGLPLHTSFHCSSIRFRFFQRVGEIRLWWREHRNRFCMSFEWVRQSCREGFGRVQFFLRQMNPMCDRDQVSVFDQVFGLVYVLRNSFFVKKGKFSTSIIINFLISNFIINSASNVFIFSLIWTNLFNFASIW